MADTVASEPVNGAAKRSRRRRRRRRRVLVVAAVGVLAVAGAGSALAMSGTDAPTYRLVRAALADVGQTVDADGTLSADDRATLSFAAAGTVASVSVAVGDTVTAGQQLATLDPSDLDAAVTSARSALATAKQTLANDQEAQANGTTVSTSGGSAGGSSGGSTGGSAGGAATTSNAVEVDSAVAVRLTAAVAPTPKSGAPAQPTSGATTSVRTAQAAVITQQRALDKAITAQDAAVDTLADSCAASDDTTPATVTVTAPVDGTVAGAAGSGKAVVTLRTTGGDLAATSSTNPQRVGAGDHWSFAGLDAGTSYWVEIVRSGVVDSDECTTAVSAVVADQREVDSAAKTLATAITALDKAVAAIPTTTTGSGSGRTSAPSSGRSAGTTNGDLPTAGTGSQPTTSTGGAGSTGSTGTTGVLVTAARIAADTKTVDAKAAALSVAKQNRRHATLTASIAGTVAAVAIAKGDSVSAASSTATVTVVGAGTLSSVVDIGIAAIDLVKVGQPVAVSVDGRTTPLAGRVTFIGTSNTAGTSSSSATYPVSVVLDKRDPSLYDGMGAGLAIDVGTAKHVLTVPLSAVHTTGTRSTVEVHADGSVTAKQVTLGLVGEDRVQIKSGLTAGDEVVLAEVSAAVPSSTTSTRRGTGSLGGLTGTGGFSGGPPGGGFGGR